MLGVYTEKSIHVKGPIASKTQLAITLVWLSLVFDLAVCPILYLFSLILNSFSVLILNSFSPMCTCTERTVCQILMKPLCV